MGRQPMPKVRDRYLAELEAEEGTLGRPGTVDEVAWHPQG